MIPVTSIAWPAACSREPGCRPNRAAVTWVTATCRAPRMPVPAPVPVPILTLAPAPGSAPETSLALRPSALR